MTQKISFFIFNLILDEGGLFDPIYHESILFTMSLEQGLGSPKFQTLLLLVIANT